MIRSTEIRKLRKRKNLSMEALAAAVGVSVAMISRYETGKVSRPNIVVIRAMERALEVPKGAFFD